MTTPQREAPRSGLKAATLEEDLRLLLFQPDSGTIAGENTLSTCSPAECLPTSPSAACEDQP